MWFGNTLGRAGTTQGADIPPGQRDPALENVPCRVDIAVRQQTAAVVFGTALARISRVIWFESGRFFSRSPVLTGGGERGHCV